MVYVSYLFINRAGLDAFSSASFDDKVIYIYLILI